METQTQTETPVDVSASSNIDLELDTALSKSFASHIKSEAPKEAPPIQENKEVKNEKEIKPVEQAQDKPKATEPTEDAKPLLTAEEIEKINPKDKGAWGAVKNANKRAHSMLEQRDVEIQKLKATLAEKSSNAQKELEAIKKEKTELEKYRAMVDIQADPEFVSKYDQPIEKAVTGIKGMLSEMGVSADIVGQIDFNNTKLLEEIVGHVSKNRDEFVARKLKRKIEEYLDLSDKRGETLQEQQKNYKETLENRKKESFAKASEGEGRMIRHLELKASEKGQDGNPLIPFLSKIQPKEGATPIEVQQSENHNNMVDAMNKKLQSVLKMKEPEDQAEIAIAAVASHYFVAENKALKEELRKAKEELSKISVASTETTTRKPASAVRNGNGEILDTESAVSNFFGRTR